MLTFLILEDLCDLHSDLLSVIDHGIQSITCCLVAKVARDLIGSLFEEHPSLMKSMYLAQLIDKGTPLLLQHR